jgi:diguanylate cyclase (GGDEF)-like protein
MWLIACGGVIALAIYPFLPATGQQALFSVLAWGVVIPVAIGARRSPPELRLSWGLLLLALSIGAVSNLLRRIPTGQTSALHVALSIEPGVFSLLVLIAAILVVLRRGRNDLGGLIDASLAALALGGLLWTVIMIPAVSEGRETASTFTLGVVVMVQAATIGALGRLIETDTGANRALRLLLAGMVCGLAGFVLSGAWHGPAAQVVAVMLFMSAYIALAMSSLDPSLARLARAGPPGIDRLGLARLIFLGVTLLAVPLVAGVRVAQGRPVDGAFIIIAAAFIVALVMLRVGLLARQLHQSQAALRELAIRDPLTGLLNRRAFTDTLNAALRTPTDCLLVFCDLNDFKQINDQYGHATGDKLLADVAQRLTTSTRKRDVLGRLGGDEFLILVRETGADGEGQIRHRITRALQAPFCSSDLGADVTISASIGTIVSEAATRGNLSAEELIGQADVAMYADKATIRPPATVE